MLLEICANSFQSAYNAQKAGAHRIELCVDLDVGGLTPSYGLIKKVLQDLSIKTFVLIRPRKGDFNYNDDEFEIMKSNILMAKGLGCSGIVSGILKTDYSIDTERTQELIELTKPLRFTFHRAFDLLTEPFKGLEELIDLGAERVLTSGQEYSAKKGITLLKELNNKANDRIIIMPGGGIDGVNATAFKEADFSEIHAAALPKKEDVKRPQDVEFNNIIRYSSIEKIRAILKAVNYEK
jgi:copper homeostasis protein